METEANVAVKIEPDSGSEATQVENVCKVVLHEDVKIKSEPMEENDDVKLEPMEVGASCAPESIMVKLEPKYYSSGDGHQAHNTSSASQNTQVTRSPTSRSKRAEKLQGFEDLLKTWENNEEQEEVGFFFAYCRATADCGGYDIDTDTDIDPDEQVENVPKYNHDSSKYFIGRNGYKWSKSPVSLPGKQYNASPSCFIPSEHNPYNLWTHLVDDSILQEVLKWTNVKLAECKAQICGQSNPNLDKLDMIELKAFFGSFMYSVCSNINIHPVDEMYTDGILYMPIFDCLMSKDRFLSILNCLSFGDPQLANDSSDRNIAVLFERFVQNSGKMYKGSSYAVIGETVIPFWGEQNDERFPRKYTERPYRDGFRLPCLFDVDTGFLYNMYIPYADLGTRGFTGEEQQFCESTQLALLLTKPIHGKNVNVTCNKEYMSLELIDAFAKHRLTSIGTLEKIHKEIPLEFLPSKKRAKGTVLYGYSKNITLMSYMNKRSRATIIASSKPCEIDEKATKPTLLQLYNKTKYARMLSDGNDFDCNFHRRTKLVSTALFYKLFYFSIHNTHILCSLNMKKKVPIYNVVMVIAKELCKQHLMRRAVDRSVPVSLRGYIANMLENKKNQDEDEYSSKYSSSE